MVSCETTKVNLKTQMVWDSGWEKGGHTCHWVCRLFAKYRYKWFFIFC